MQYMSIITNFGCHYKCPYCIVKENNLHIPRTTLAGLDNLEEALKENGCNIVSISGGGDPLHEYEKHGNQTGLYCSACGKWQKWLKKDEIRLFNHGVKVENASLLERLKARIEESAIKVSTVKAPHTYMKAVGTRELEKILEEELGNEDTKRHTC